MHDSSEHDAQQRDSQHDASPHEQDVVTSGPDEGGEVQQPDPDLGESIEENPAEGYDPERPV